MPATLYISGSRLAENFRAVENVAGADATVLAVVKADAYGHGAALCAPVLAAAGARWMGVGDAEEGAAVRRALGQDGPQAPVQDGPRVLVMCGMELHDAEAMLAHRLTPVVWTPGHVEAMEHAARAASQAEQTEARRTAVHLEIDSGMSRQGAQPGEPLAQVLARLAASPWLACEGVLTHLAAAEEVGSAMTARQQTRFAAGLRQVLDEGLRPEWLHLANTSALDEASTTAWLRGLAAEHASAGYAARVMVRTGLALYGYCLPLAQPRAPGSEPPPGEHSEPEPVLAPRLHPVLVWKTCVVGVREIAAGEQVGYGASWTADRPTRLALLPVGYADGFRRGASSGLGDGWVMIGDRRAPVVGRVSMNLTTVDVTDIPAVREGAEVTLLGPGATPEDHARWNGTIPYEILCGLRGHRVLR